jgi:hypothetical protein
LGGRPGADCERGLISGRQDQRRVVEHPDGGPRSSGSLDQIRPLAGAQLGGGGGADSSPSSVRSRSALVRRPCRLVRRPSKPHVACS